jgi:hypothetical protein
MRGERPLSENHLTWPVTGPLGASDYASASSSFLVIKELLPREVEYIRVIVMTVGSIINLQVSERNTASVVVTKICTLY